MTGELFAVVVPTFVRHPARVVPTYGRLHRDRPCSLVVAEGGGETVWRKDRIAYQLFSTAEDCRECIAALEEVSGISAARRSGDKHQIWAAQELLFLPVSSYRWTNKKGRPDTAPLSYWK
jgi:hypothetical protein